MARRALAASLFGLGVTLTHVAGAQTSGSACPVAQIGQPCAGSSMTCVQASCCDDLSSGCDGSGGGSASGSSGSNTNPFFTCAVCEPVSGAYCLPAEIGQPCSDGGICTASGGGARLIGTDGGIAYVSYQTCDSAGSDGGAEDGASSSGAGNSGSDGVGSSGLGGSGSSTGSTTSGEGSAAHDNSGGGGGGGCAITTGSGPSAGGGFVALVAGAALRRRRRAR